MTDSDVREKELLDDDYQSEVMLWPEYLSYTYDLAGRRVGMRGSLATTQLPEAVSSATYNANNQLTQWGSTAMTYDANGNTLNDGFNSYVWDAQNRLVSADNNAASFSYDPLGRRVNKTILSSSTNYLYDGYNPIQELSGAIPTANMLTGGIDEYFERTDSTGTYYYLTDGLGSTAELTDPTGASQVRYSYSPYGTQSATGATTTNSYTYTGRETDGLGINYYRARYYNPATGRFLSEDPLGFAGSGTNLYGYAEDDPMNHTDPSGKDTYDCSSPLQGLGPAGLPAYWATAGPGGSGGLYHEYLCVITGTQTICNGQSYTPPNSPWTVGPGSPSNDSFEQGGGTCDRVSNRSCIDQCVLTTLAGPRPPYQVLNQNGGTNCQQYAQQTLNSCQQQCGGNMWMN